MPFLTKTFQDVSNYSEKEQLLFLMDFPKNAFFLPEKSNVQFRELLSFCYLFSGMHMENFAKSMNTQSYRLMDWIHGGEIPQPKLKREYAVNAVRIALRNHNVRPLYA